METNKVTILMILDPGEALLIALALNSVNDGSESLKKILTESGREFLHNKGQEITDQIARTIDPESDPEYNEFRKQFYPDENR